MALSASHYKVVKRRQDVGVRITTLYQQQPLAVGILDVDSQDSLIGAINWYLENFNYALQVVTSAERFEKLNLQDIYPDVSFIVFRSQVSIGEKVNAIADECHSTYFMVVRSDTSLLDFNGQRLFGAMASREKPVIITPILLNSGNELLPTVKVPHLSGKELDPLSFQPSVEEGVLQNTLYSLQALGLYETALFQRLKYYDTDILGSYYQCMDFGIRAYLYGNTVLSSSDFILRFFNKSSFIEDRSACEGMNRCYTRALSIRRIAGKNVAEKWKPYYDRELFKTEVKTKQVLAQKTDFFTLMQEWKGGEQ